MATEYAPYFYQSPSRRKGYIELLAKAYAEFSGKYMPENAQIMDKTAFIERVLRPALLFDEPDIYTHSRGNIYDIRKKPPRNLSAFQTILQIGLSELIDEGDSPKACHDCEVAMGWQQSLPASDEDSAAVMTLPTPNDQERASDQNAVIYHLPKRHSA